MPGLFTPVQILPFPDLFWKNWLASCWETETQISSTFKTPLCHKFKKKNLIEWGIYSHIFRSINMNPVILKCFKRLLLCFHCFSSNSVLKNFSSEQMTTQCCPYHKWIPPWIRTAPSLLSKINIALIKDDILDSEYHLA